MRLFIALDLPEPVQEELRQICCGLPGARWTPLEQLHLTLRFIGETDGGMFRTISHALAEIRCPAFALQLRGIGFFPPRKTPHTLWVGVEKSDDLLQLHRKMESALTAVGLETEQRKFAPHVTLARLRNTPADRIGGFLAQHSLLSPPPFQVSAFRLYSSVLSRSGAKHYAEAEYLLAAA
jgi:RNA 2',3'-cyclic 3'-phosphodiesterase